MEETEYRFIEPLDIVEPMIKTEGTIFGVLIKAHGLTHVKENIYKSASGRKYHLTKFGLEPGVIYSAHETARKIQHELEDVSEQLVKARRKIEKLESKPANREGALAQLNEKVKNQTEVIKRLHEELHGTDDDGLAIKSKGKTKNEKITLLRGQIKMKNIEIAELKRQLKSR